MNKLLAVLLLALPCRASLVLAERGEARAAIVLDAAAGPVARKAASLLRDRVKKKSGAVLPLAAGAEAARLPEALSRIVIGPPDGRDVARWLGNAGVKAPGAAELGEEGFWLGASGRTLFLIAREGRGNLYAVGKLLRTAVREQGTLRFAGQVGLDTPAMPVRVLYLAIHCDNFYEMQEAAAIEPIVEDMAMWGISGLSVWLDETQYNDPFDNSVDNAAVRAKWNKQKQVMRIAQSLGLKVGYVLSANDLYRNQVRPELAAKGTDSWNKAQLACPSTAAGRAAILRNKDNLFRDMAESGIRLDNALLFPYDTGGCFDDRCRPWIRTFLNLTGDVAAVLHRYHPDARAYITDWHCKDDEAAIIIDFFNRVKPKWLAGIWKDDRHPVTRFAAVDKSYRTLTFMDITEIGAWGTVGANPFAGRLREFMSSYHGNGQSGYMAYSEGIYDDFNKAASAQLAWNPSKPVAEIAAEYGSYFFDLPAGGELSAILGGMERSWSNPLSAWSQVKFVQPPEDAAKLQALTSDAGAKLAPGIRDSWRWQVIERRARIGRLAAELRDRAAFRAQVEQRASREEQSRLIGEKEAVLAEYSRAVVELRDGIYREPATRFPAMIAEEKFMTGIMQVDVGAWAAELKDLRARYALR